MKPPPSRDEREGGGEISGYNGRPVVTPNTSRTQVSTLPPEILAEWGLELSRRLARAKALLSFGLPDPGFDLLAEEIHQFNQTCLAFAAAPQKAAA